MPSPLLLTMLSIQPPIEGDDALLRLAQSRLAEAGLGGELYPGSQAHLRRLLEFRPGDQPCTAHLPRGIDLLSEQGRAVLMEYVQIAAGRLYGVLVHDQRRFANDPEQTLLAFRETDRLVSSVSDAPLVFVEYAAGMEPALFASLFEQCADTRHLCAATDVGHVGIQVCRNAFRESHPEQDICALQPDTPQLSSIMEAVQSATDRALPAVIELIKRLAAFDKPLHFHLHDGHPLSTLSQFGVCDHLSFLQQIGLPFPYQGRKLIGGMFGVSGLRHIIRTALGNGRVDRLSFMMELHPQEGRSPLGEHRELFQHWGDKTNAERMNFWLDRLLDNAALVRAVWEE